MADARRLLSELERTSAQLAAVVDRRLQGEAGLPLVLFEPMSVIASRDICRVYELATELGISSGGASKLVDRLEALGHCRRHPNPGDRRSSLLKLTPAGAALLAIAQRIVDAELNDMLGSRLSRTEIAQLTTILHDLRAIVPAPPRSGAPPRHSCRQLLAGQSDRARPVLAGARAGSDAIF